MHGKYKNKKVSRATYSNYVEGEKIQIKVKEEYSGEKLNRVYYSDGQSYEIFPKWKK